MIITDYWMPEMIGYDLLKKVDVMVGKTYVRRRRHNVATS
jgi:hypothetical protein